MKEAIKTLLDSGNEAVITFTRKDLLGEEVDIRQLWILPRVKKPLRKQQPDGSWIYPNKKAKLRSPTNYNQYQTYKTIAELVELYRLTCVYSRSQVKSDREGLIRMRRESARVTSPEN